MNSRGEVVRPLDEAQLRQVLDVAKAKGAEAIAICFLHSYRNPAHELRAAEIAKAHSNWFVTTSHELSREYREYERTSTVVMNAFVGPKVSRYVENLEALLAEQGFNGRFFLMESNGGVADAATIKQLPALLMESGPVGGIAGSIKLGETIERRNLLTFDMGGTTAKAALVENGVVSFDSLYYVGGFEHGYPRQTSVVDVVEVGAGGGSPTVTTAERKVSPKWSGSIRASSPQRMTARSITFWSSRILPGQGCWRSASRQAEDKPWTRTPFLRA